MNRASIVNSILVAVCLGVMAWVGQKAADNAEQLAGMRASVDALKASTDKAETAQGEALLRMEKKLDDLVPRREFESKLLLAEADLRKLDLKLRELDIELLKQKGAK